MNTKMSHYNASQIRYNAHEKALNAYTTASFNAAKTASLGYLDAAIKELVDNANAEKDIYGREMNYYDGKVAGVEALLPDIEAYAAAGTTTYATALTHKNTVNVTAEISTAKLANKAVRIATDLVTGVTYKVSENIAWVSYYGKSITADVKYLASYVQTEMAFANAKKAADAAYDEVVTPAWTSHSKLISDLTTILFAAIRMANDPFFAIGTLFQLGINALQGNFDVVTMKTTGDDDGKNGSNSDSVLSQAGQFLKQAQAYAMLPWHKQTQIVCTAVEIRTQDVPVLGEIVRAHNEFWYTPKPFAIDKTFLNSGTPSIIIAPNGNYKEEFESGNPNYTTTNAEIAQWYTDSAIMFLSVIAPELTARGGAGRLPARPAPVAKPPASPANTISGNISKATGATVQSEIAGAGQVAPKLTVPPTTATNNLLKIAMEDQLRIGYNADAWQMTTLPKGSVVYGGMPGRSSYYFSQSTLEKSGLNQKALWDSLQVRPNPKFPSRPFVTRYEILEDLQVPTSDAWANQSVAPGGGQQFFIPDYYWQDKMIIRSIIILEP